jgi:hypothetical protein
MLDGLDELGRERVDEDGRYDPRKRFVAKVPEDEPVIVTCRLKDNSDIGAQVGLNGADRILLSVEAIRTNSFSGSQETRMRGRFAKLRR